jgi:acetoin utilization protein AcuB
MRVKDFMSRRVITVSETARVQEAMALLKQHSIRHLPVDRDGRFIGLVTEGDLRGAVWPSLVEDIQVKDLMISDPIVVHPETRLEEAARLVHQHKIGCLPVVDRKGSLKGIITVVDLLAAVIEFMGLLTASSRLDVRLPERPEAFEEVSRIIQEHGGRIISVGLIRKRGGPVHLFRLEKINLAPMVAGLKEAGYNVVSSSA